MLVKVRNKDEFQDSVPFVFSHEGFEIVVLLHIKEFYAFNKDCPHAKGDLSKGRFENGSVTCLNHGLQFYLCNGNINTDELDEDITDNIDLEILNKYVLKTYTVVAINNDIYIEFP